MSSLSTSSKRGTGFFTVWINLFSSGCMKLFFFSIKQKESTPLTVLLLLLVVMLILPKNKVMQ